MRRPVPVNFNQDHAFARFEANVEQVRRAAVEFGAPGDSDSNEAASGEAGAGCGPLAHDVRHSAPRSMPGNQCAPRFMGLNSLPFRLLQQAHQIFFPQHGFGVAAVSHRLATVRNHDGLAVFHPLDLAFEDAQAPAD